ncbi:RNA repair domain-containing protein [[Eubacterium] cellulosolvens]
MHPLKNVLTRILWDRAVSPQDFEITYVHRGGPGDRATVNGSTVVRVGKSWFSVMREREEVIIPFHRILLLRNLKTGETLWQGRKSLSRG